MAVKTQVSDDDFATILARYDLGTLQRAEPIAAGTIQTNYILHLRRASGTTHKVVFRCYENRSCDSVRFETDLLAFLTDRHYPCPAPYAARDGALAAVYRDKPYALFEFLEGHHVEDPTPRQREQLIQKAAELQIVTRGFTSPYTPYRWNYSPELCRALGRDAAERLGTPTAYAKLAWLEHQLDALDLPPSVPRGICHCDFHFSNVLFQGDRFVALLDFDDANYTYMQFDLVVLIESAAWHHARDTIDLAAARAVVRTYDAYRPLPEVERTHLFDVYKLAILFDGIWFYARGGATDFYEKRKIDHLTALGREQFTASLFYP